MTHDILHILGTAQPDGAAIARVVTTLGQGLDPARYRTSALFLQGPGPLVEQMQGAGIEVEALNWWRGARDPLGAWRFWKSVRARRPLPQIVHMHFGGRSVRRLARKGTQAKILMHLHSRIEEPQGLALVSFKARGLDAVVAVCQAVANQVVDVPARVIYTGIKLPPGDPAGRQPRNRPELILGAAGRLVELKGLEYLLNATGVLRREFPTLRVEVAGAGPERDKLEQQAARLGLADCVTFLGWVHDLSSVLPRWDIFVTPSLEEAFSYATLEAMAAALPVVASAAGGLPELVDDGITGCLAPPGDADALASRLRPLLVDRELRLKMGAAAYARARDHFSSAQMTRNFARLYDELLGESRT